MNGTNSLLATVDGLILTRAMLGIVEGAVTAGTGVTTPWNTIGDVLNRDCGTAFAQAAQRAPLLHEAHHLFHF